MFQSWPICWPQKNFKQDWCNEFRVWIDIKKRLHQKCLVYVMILLLTFLWIQYSQTKGKIFFSIRKYGLWFAVCRPITHRRRPDWVLTEKSSPWIIPLQWGPGSSTSSSRSSSRPYVFVFICIDNLFSYLIHIWNLFSLLSRKICCSFFPMHNLLNP